MGNPKTHRPRRKTSNPPKGQRQEAAGLCKCLRRVSALPKHGPQRQRRRATCIETEPEASGVNTVLLRETQRGRARGSNCQRLLPSPKAAHRSSKGFSNRHLCYAGQGTRKEPLHPQAYEKHSCSGRTRPPRPLGAPPATPKEVGAEQELSTHTQTLTLHGKADSCEAQVRKLILADGRPNLLQQSVSEEWGPPPD